MKFLFLGTLKDNAIDRERKKRGNHPIGSRNGHAKLVEWQARVIFRLSKSGFLSASEIGHFFGVTSGGVFAIKYGDSWAHVTGAGA